MTQSTTQSSEFFLFFSFSSSYSIHSSIYLLLELDRSVLAAINSVFVVANSFFVAANSSWVADKFAFVSSNSDLVPTNSFLVDANSISNFLKRPSPSISATTSCFPIPGAIAAGLGARPTPCLCRFWTIPSARRAACLFPSVAVLVENRNLLS